MSSPTQRHLPVAAVVVLASLILVIKVGHLQLFDDTFKDRSRTYAIEKRLIYPARGLIYDRNDRLLVQNEPSYDLMVTAAQMDPQMDTTTFCRLLGIDRATFQRQLDIDWSDIRYSRQVPTVFLSKVSPAVRSRAQEQLFQYPGFFFQDRLVRSYPEPHGAHVLGYLGEVDQSTIEESAGRYLPGDYRGLSGLEGSFEDTLRGERGARYLLKDNLGRPVGAFKDGDQDREPVSGRDLLTTLDIELTAYAETLMRNKKGAIVAIEPATGEILALVSSPYYDPNLLVISQERGDAFAALLQDSLKPFFDRSVMARYPPGSIFKPILGLIALQEGITQAQRYIPCDGAYHVNDESWGCHAHWPCRTMGQALAVSCNSYFFQLTRELLDRYGADQLERGLTQFNKILETFGLGHPLGIGMATEKSGSLPTYDYYRGLYTNRSWNSATIMNIGIGQGELELTTIQMAHLASIIANRGKVATPHLVRAVRGPDGTQTLPVKRGEVPIDPVHFTPIINGLEQVLTYGTAQRALIPGIPFCGKTGTSQNPHGKDHSVFFGFAPKENPQIAIAVYIENAGWGGDYAAPIASLVVEKHLRDTILPQRQWLEDQMIRTNINALP